MSDEETLQHLVVPEDNYYYTENHEWVSLDDKNSITIGITYYAQYSIGDVVSWELPQKGQFFEKGASVGVIHTVKSSFDIYMPVSGEVVDVNSNLDYNVISDKPMTEGWLIRVEVAKESELTSLLSPAAYKKLIEEQVKSLE